MRSNDTELCSTNILELVVCCKKCKREIPDNGIYYKHPQLGIVCEYCPEFFDGVIGDRGEDADNEG